MAEPAPAGDVRTQRLDGLRAPESLRDTKALAEPAILKKEGTRAA